MKSIFNMSLVLVALLPCIAFAEEIPPEVGFIRLINVVAPGTGNTTFMLNGENLYKKGYTLGQYTGGIGIRSGSHDIKVEKEGVQSGNTTFTVGTGETLTLIAFAERVPPEDPEDPPEWKSRILRLKQNDAERGFMASFVSLCESPQLRLSATIAEARTTQQVTVNRLDMSTIDLGTRRSEVIVRLDENVITVISPDTAGNYVVILYEDEEGNVRGLSFYDPKFVIAG